MNARHAASRRITSAVCALLFGCLSLVGCDKLDGAVEEPDAVDTAVPDTRADDGGIDVDTSIDDPDTATEPPEDVLLETSEPDGGDATVDGTSPDATDATDATDTEPDVVIDPIRTVGTLPVFGSMPIENRFRDPRFGLDASVWQGYAFDQRSYALFRRAVPTSSPEGQPVMVVSGAPENAVGKYILGTANAGRGQHRLSLWLGRASSATDAELAQVDVELIGWGPAGDATTVIGAVAGATETHGDVEWQRYEAEVGGYWGSVELLLADASGDALWVGAPTLVELTTAPGGVRPIVQRPVEVRGFDAVERTLFETSQRRWLDQPPPQQRRERLKANNPLPSHPGQPTRLRR